MNVHRAYVGVGANIGNVAETIERAIESLREFAIIVAQSSFYRTQPRGRPDQPDYINAVVLLETRLKPLDLLRALQSIEAALGRVRNERWGPRTIDLDLLVYDEIKMRSWALRLPHPRLHERAFVLVPLAEIDSRYAPLRDALDEAELHSVARIVTPMPSKRIPELVARIEALVRFLESGDATRVRVRRADEEIEIVRRADRLSFESPAHEDADAEAAASRTETIKADIVGIFHVVRPMPVAGDMLDGDRELGYIEALGIRTPVRNIGSGRIVSVATADGVAVEYGQPLFVIARG